MIVDTSFLIDLLRGDTPALNLLERLEESSEALRVPAPCLFELWEGIERSRHPPREAERVNAILQGFPIVGLEARHATRAGKLSGAMIRKGLRPDPLDVLIAGVALEEGERVVTRDERDFARFD
ncbi:MAG: PIN domain-containing protein, partial [Methanobacteriota archaeon]